MLNRRILYWIGLIGLSGWMNLVLLSGTNSPMRAGEPRATPEDLVSAAMNSPLAQPAMPPPVPTVITNLHLPMIRLPPGPLYFPMTLLPNPLLPTGPIPPDGAMNQSPNAYLMWSTFEPPAGLVRYDLYLEANNPQPSLLIAQGLHTNSFDPATFELDRQYYWRVVTYDDQGRQAIGPVWSFRVEPLLDSPEIGTMVLVPAGEFLMGCDSAVEDCSEANALPLHPVYLDGYEFDKYEVTNREYRDCVAAGVCPVPRRFDAPGRKSYFDNPEFDLFPVMYVSWWNALTYCQWVGKRLPTEAEWEKAARGPIDTRPWPWGIEGPTCERANFSVRCSARTDQVGSHPTGASPYGAMDMAGNMFEWVADRYVFNYYTFSPHENPQGPFYSRPDPNKPRTPHPYYVIRGGSYHDNWWYARVTHRHWGHHGDTPGHDAPNYRSFRVGIRCARALAE